MFLTATKEPPIAHVQAFLAQFGNASGGLVRTDQGVELSCSNAFWEALLLREFEVEENPYILEPTGADSPSQNSGAETWNGTLANTVRVLLYSAGLPAKYW